MKDINFGLTVRIQIRIRANEFATAASRTGKPIYATVVSRIAWTSGHDWRMILSARVIRENTEVIIERMVFLDENKNVSNSIEAGGTAGCRNGSTSSAQQYGE
jgi:hypothetical protein